MLELVMGAGFQGGRHLITSLKAEDFSLSRVSQGDSVEERRCECEREELLVALKLEEGVMTQGMRLASGPVEWALLEAGEGTGTSALQLQGNEF